MNSARTHFQQTETAFRNQLEAQRAELNKVIDSLREELDTAKAALRKEQASSSAIMAEELAKAETQFNNALSMTRSQAVATESALKVLELI